MTDHTTSHRVWYHLIDAYRGFALLNMLFFHFFFDIYMIFRQDPDWYHRPVVHIWQQFICISFLFVSGISWHFSQNNVKRGLLLNLYGLIITAVTFVFMPSQTVWFGILNCIGCCTLLMIPLHKLWNRPRTASPRQKVWKCGLGLFLSILLFLFTRNLSDGYVGMAFFSFPVPEAIYHFRPMTILGFPYPGFFSGDYFPILPWFFLFVAGYWFWELISCQNSLLGVFRIRIPILSRLGQKTIWIYMLHQPFLYGVAYLLTQVMNLSF